MDQLWRDWRMEYIQSARDPDAGCVLCELVLREPEDALVLKTSPRAFVVMNLYPYNPGHLMVVPTRHTSALESLDPDEIAETGRLLQESVDVLQAVMAPDGFNLGMNLGRVAGAGVPDHLHWHIVPRWSGDANFMPIVGQTRVLPELVAQTYRKLLPAFGIARP
jgi:ATP adenylyltransferase